MATTLELAAFSYDAYRPSDENNILPTGWQLDLNIAGEDRGDGFDASAFFNGSEVVIAFRGTDFPDGFPTVAEIEDWLAGNGPAAFGLPSEQVRRAIEFAADSDLASFTTTESTLIAEMPSLVPALIALWLVDPQFAVSSALSTSFIARCYS